MRPSGHPPWDSPLIPRGPRGRGHPGSACFSLLLHLHRAPTLPVPSPGRGQTCPALGRRPPKWIPVASMPCAIHSPLGGLKVISGCQVRVSHCSSARNRMERKSSPWQRGSGSQTWSPCPHCPAVSLLLELARTQRLCSVDPPPETAFSQAPRSHLLVSPSPCPDGTFSVMPSDHSLKR